MSKIYTRPVLRVQGKLEAMTHGMRSGKRLDNDFASGTQVSDLTFS